MDPLAAAASFMTVLGTLITSIDKSYSVINCLRDAPKEVQELGQEVLELKGVMIDAQAAANLDVQSTQGSNTPELRSSLTPQIERAQKTLSTIEDIAKDLTRQTPMGSPSISRKGWLMNRKKVERLRDELERQKMNITISLQIKTMYAYYYPTDVLLRAKGAYSSTPSTHLHRIVNGFESVGNEVHVMGHRLAQHELASSSRGSEHLLLLQQIRQGETHLVCRLERNHLPANRETLASTTANVDPQAPSTSPVSGISPAERQSFLFASGSQIIPLNHNAVRTLEKSGARTRLGVCPCRCHRTLRYSICPITSKLFGSLIIGVSGRMLSNSACDSLQCRNHPHYSITVAYYFPSWLVAKFIIFHCVRSPYGQPSLGLQVRNLLPEYSQAMGAIFKGQPLLLQSMLEDRSATPNDMEEMGWTLLTVRDFAFIDGSRIKYTC